MSNIGMRIYSEINRPSEELIQRFKNFPSSVVADNMNRMSCLHPRIKPINGQGVLGPAFTVKTRPGDNLLLHKALDMANKGDIIVVDGQGELTNALMGELMAMWAKKHEIGGFVIDGAIRDLSSLKKIEIPIYAAGVSPRGPYKDGPGEINVPISCGGVSIKPGDIILGDEDGVVVIDPKDSEILIEKAQKKLDSERNDMIAIENLQWNRSWLNQILKEKNTNIY
ncbi:RraA family protein [Metabacillus herbersteinensis]|uniref:Putative 4-hydroxy-4-methyl-2-oxoglutarate aldolase n=1 Tax=Metabacillus herbersteinensis TaxID=283816 RepID=A0ABV6GGQ1_9BACI